jgi:sugar O-acyltransferase (sialic acid O-acetyltransferase NeuD family)
MSELAKRVAIVGAGDLGKSLMRQIADIPALRFVGFFDDTAESDPHLLGTIDDAATSVCRTWYDELVMGIGYRHLRFRQTLFERLRDQGIQWATVTHPSATVATSASIGEGTIVSAGCLLDVGVTIGANTLLNIGCVIAHDSSVGAHTFLGPSVNVAGFVTIGQRCFLGVGTTIIDNQRLKDGCQTAAGAVVTSDVGPSKLVAGVPAVTKKTLES